MGRLNDGQLDGARSIATGEMRTYTGRNSNAEKDVCLNRTSRPYAEDLADAYNASMDPSARERGAQWFVAPNGELHLGFSDHSIRENGKRTRQRMETERARHLRNTLNRPQAMAANG